MNNTKSFRLVFNKIEDYLRKITNSETDIPFSILVYKASRINNVVRVYENAKQNRLLSEIWDSLLPRLMSGRLRV